MKKIELILFTFLCFFSVTMVAMADVLELPESNEYALCVYDSSVHLDNYYFYYDVQNDIFDYGFYVYSGGKSEYVKDSQKEYGNFNLHLTPSDFINKNVNMLVCPSIWLYEDRFVSRDFYLDDSHTGDKLDLWPVLGKIDYERDPDVSVIVQDIYMGVLFIQRYCSWQDGSLNIEAIIDRVDKKILSATVNGQKASKYPSFDILYDDSYSIHDPKSCNSDVLAYCNGDNCVIGNSSDKNFMKERDKAKGELVGGDEAYGCEVIPDAIRNWIKRALNLVKYIALVLVIVLGVMDFIKAAASGEADQMKKSGTSFMKRVVAVIILFLLPYLVELILGLIDVYGANSTCLP